MIKLENCPICDGNNWHDLDYLRNTQYWYDKEFLTKEDEKLNFKICKDCGFVTYDYPDDDELKRRYELDRNIINNNHIITGNRKIKYHKAFLPMMNFSKKEKGLSVLDYGCAIGIWLNYLKNLWRDNRVKFTGVELNQISANFGRKEYGLNIVDTMPDEKYDFITCYHVLEHLKNPDKILQEFKDHLSDDGYLYIAVPENFGSVLDEASGVTTIDFENFYHLNHLSFFSKTSLQNILKKTGFKIVKENDTYYGYTVLCQKDYSNVLTNTIIKQNYQDIVSVIENQKKAIELVQETPEKAIEIMPNFADAYVIQSMKSFKDLKKQEEILSAGLKATNNHYKLRRAMASLYYQWNENMAGEHNITNHIRRAKEIFEDLIIAKPGQEDNFYFLAMLEAKYYKNYEKAREYFTKIIEINPQKWGEIINLVGWLRKEETK